jgi:hypothetical protein
MHLKKMVKAGLLMVLLAVGGGAHAGTDLNEVGAFLVYPVVAAFAFDGNTDWYGGSSTVETFVTITNAGSSDIVAHVSYINGDSWDSTYCYECDFDVPLTGKDTETLVVTYGQFGISIESEDGTVSRSCPHPFGFITVNIEDPETGNVLTDNFLLGSEIVVDYDGGFALSIPAIPFQGKTAGVAPEEGARTFVFDDVQYGKLPRVVAADFIAPDLEPYGITGALSLFTLGFDRQHPPKVDCSVTGYDADENPFSRSFQFGCWTFQDLCDLDPEFCYPNLSHGPCNAYGEGNPNLPNCDTHGWLQLNCRVDQDNNGTYDGNGGVHGAILQAAYDYSVIRRNDWGAPSFDEAAWGRLLYQSVTGGDPVTLHLEGPAVGLD